MNALGSHFLLDLQGVDKPLLDNMELLEETMIKAVKKGGATVVDSRFSKFEPQGVSGVVIIAESHVTCHTWPEIGYAAVDVFTCGSPKVGRAICDEIILALKPVSHFIKSIDRGLHLTSEIPKVVNR